MDKSKKEMRKQKIEEKTTEKQTAGKGTESMGNDSAILEMLKSMKAENKEMFEKMENKIDQNIMEMKAIINNCAADINKPTEIKIKERCQGIDNGIRKKVEANIEENEGNINVGGNKNNIINKMYKVQNNAYTVIDMYKVENNENKSNCYGENNIANNIYEVRNNVMERDRYEGKIEGNKAVEIIITEKVKEEIGILKKHPVVEKNIHEVEVINNETLNRKSKHVVAQDIENLIGRLDRFYDLSKYPGINIKSNICQTKMISFETASITANSLPVLIQVPNINEHICVSYVHRNLKYSSLNGNHLFQVNKIVEDYYKKYIPDFCTRDDTVNKIVRKEIKWKGLETFNIVRGRKILESTREYILEKDKQFCVQDILYVNLKETYLRCDNKILDHSEKHITDLLRKADILPEGLRKSTQWRYLKTNHIVRGRKTFKQRHECIIKKGRRYEIKEHRKKKVKIKKM